MQKQQIDVLKIAEDLRNITNKCIHEKGDIPFEPICEILVQFTIVFPKLNSFLGVAFKDIIDKVAIIRENNKRFPGHIGFLSFIRMEMENKIHIYNGQNNSKKKAPAEYKNYTSTARTLLRMMWFLTFVSVTFNELKNKPTEKLSEILNTAYDTAFNEKHAWLVRKGAKIAIMASTDRKSLVEVMVGKYDQKVFNEQNQKFLAEMKIPYDLLWKFYKDNGLVDLQ